LTLLKVGWNLIIGALLLFAPNIIRVIYESREGEGDMQHT
jgi:hypothetical protein